MKRFLIFMLVLSMGLQAAAEVERLVAVSAAKGPNRGQEAIVRALFANGQEIRKMDANAPVSDDQNYVVFPDGNGVRQLFELEATVLGLTSNFEPRHFVRLFEVDGQVTVFKVLEPGQGQVWNVRARSAGRLRGDWIDPALNQ